MATFLSISFAPAQFSQTELPNRIKKMCTNGNKGNDKLDLHGFRHGGGLKAKNTLGTRLRLH